MSRTPAVCTGCRRLRPIKSDDHCGTCYTRRYQPLVGNPGAAGVHKSRDVIAGRIEDLAELRVQRADQRQIAHRLGVSVRTVQRYQARLRQEST